MAILHVKSPNGTTQTLDVTKLNTLAEHSFTKTIANNANLNTITDGGWYKFTLDNSMNWNGTNAPSELYDTDSSSPYIFADTIYMNVYSMGTSDCMQELYVNIVSGAKSGYHQYRRPMRRYTWEEWNTYSYLPLSGGTITGDIIFDGDFIKRSSDDSLINIIGSSNVESYSGAYIHLYGKSHSDYPGWFSISSTNGNSRFLLQGHPDGNLTWKNRDVECVDSKSLGASGYIRYTSGLQIVYGGSSVSTTDTTITFTKPFSSTPKIGAIINNTSANLGCHDITATNFKIKATSSGTMHYIAIGPWA